MPVLKVFKGQNGYKDDDAIKNLVEYPFQSGKGYMGDFDSRNLIITDDTPSAITDQITFVNKSNTRKQIHMDHFVISVSDIMYDTQMIEQIKGIVLNHFGKGGVDGSYFQIFCAEHYLVDENNLHIHFIMNHVSTGGTAFPNTFHNYYALLAKLRQSTGLEWRIIQASSMDYE